MSETTFYKIGVKITGKGTCNVPAEVLVESGSDFCVSFSPAKGWKLDHLTRNGADLDASCNSDSVQLDNVMCDEMIELVFVPLESSQHRTLASNQGVSESEPNLESNLAVPKKSSSKIVERILGYFPRLRYDS